MTTYISETIWINDTDVCSLEELAEASGLSSAELQELIELGVIEPVNHDPKQHMFRIDYIILAKSARRLRDDFELDTQGLAVAINLLHRIQRLEEEIETIRAKHLPSKPHDE